MDALCGEIERLRRLKKESDGYLSRSNERRLTKCKAELRRRLGAAVIYAEDRQKIPDRSHHCFDFVVSLGTARRSYYMSDEERELNS